jgi:hypothetical protein
LSQWKFAGISRAGTAASVDEGEVTKPQIALRRFGLWLALLVAAAAYYPRFAKALDGMQLYPDAARCLMNEEVLRQCEPAMAFTYPPVFAFVMIPFVPMPGWLREVVWYAITIGAVVLSFKISEALGRRLVSDPLSARELLWVRALSLLLSIKFVLAVLENQAYDALVLLFVLLGLAALLAGREVGAGVSLAVATALKATPLVFLPYLVLKRRFVAAAVFVLAVVAVSYLPDLFFTPQGGGAGYFNTWLREIGGAAATDNAGSQHAFWAGANPLNHSLHGAVSLRIDEFRQPMLHRIILVSADLALIAAVGILLLFSGRQDRMIGLDGSVLVIAMLMLSPMTSRSHYVVLILPYTVLMWAWIRDRTTRLLGSWVLTASFMLATASSNDAAGQSISDWAYRHSLLVLGALAPLIYIAAIIRQGAGGAKPVADTATASQLAPPIRQS